MESNRLNKGLTTIATFDDQRWRGKVETVGKSSAENQTRPTLGVDSRETVSTAEEGGKRKVDLEGEPLSENVDGSWEKRYASE